MELVLDTNIYRYLVKNLKSEQIIQLCVKIKQISKEKGIKIFFPINSAMELINHYNDDNDDERNECRNALQLLVNLSTTYSSTHIHVDFTPPLNAILERYFHGQVNTHAELYSRVITIAQMLTGNMLSDSKDVMDKNIQIVKDQIEFEKKEIRDGYEEYLKSINKGVADWTFFRDKKKLRRDYFEKLRIGKLSFLIGQSFVDRAYNLLEQPIVKDDDYLKKVTSFMEEFCPALAMNELLLENIGHSVEAIKDVSDKRWNTIIDISLIFGALFNPKNVDRKLVTEERNIHASFETCDFQDKILTFDDFKKLYDI